jgi:hypothetical protein
LWENRLHFEAVSDMAAAPQGFLSLGLKILGPAFAFARPTLGKWWRRRQIPAASPTKISILVAKRGGDTAADSHHHSIREAIKSAMPGAIAVFGWPEELPVGDGLDEQAHKRAEETARAWMKSKKCSLLISGRIKSSNLISLTFTPLNSTPISSPHSVDGPQSYALTLDTMEFPAHFVDDLGAAIVACTLATVNKHDAAGFAPAIENIAVQLAACRT